MGCGSSKQQKVGQDQKVSRQDEARSFKSKFDAIKHMMKTEEARKAFMTFLKPRSKDELLVYYLEIEDIMKLSSGQLLSQTMALIRKVKARMNDKGNETVTMVWESLGPLTDSNLSVQGVETVKSRLGISQGDIVTALTPHFNEFLNSDEYNNWKKTVSKNEKADFQRRSSDKQIDRLPSIATKYPNILIADDSNVTLKVVSSILERDGHKVTTAANGEIALESMKLKSYDIVLLDLNMPVMSGFEVIDAWKSIKKKSEEFNLLQIEELRDLGQKLSEPNLLSEKKSSFKPETSSDRKNLASAENPEDADNNGGLSSSAEEGDPPVNIFTSERIAGAVTSSSGSNSNLETGAPAPPKFGSRRQLSTAEIRSRRLSADFQKINVRRPVIIGFSSAGDDETRKKVIESGMNEYLQKPFTLNKLIAAITDVEMQDS